MKRIDSTSYLYHWVKSDPHTKVQHMDYENAFQTFLKILSDWNLKHGDIIKTGGEPGLCFTESPEYFMHKDKSKYQPFGFKFYKKRIFRLGGRAVIYSPESEKELIHESIRWRYMRHDPLAISDRTPYGVDFTWEREWRLPEPELSILDAVNIIVPNERYIQRAQAAADELLHINAIEMYKYYGQYEPHPEYEEYIDTIKEKLITPEEFT
ncbi:hypothetical protein [Serratia fonticola]|uniref:hypothetical protein n=1 Tax=Serratia fonticola TaxID=47917 RepID=UPI0024DEC292|nr:hypothetical protein [Serratia fonticola]MDK2375299.1 hypothetical protein [Serratia fonticola]